MVVTRNLAFYRVGVPYRPGNTHRERAWDYVRPGLLRHELVVADSPRANFSKGSVLTAGVERPSGDVLLFHDADSIVDFDRLEEAIAEARRADGLVVAYTDC